MREAIFERSPAPETTAVSFMSSTICCVCRHAAEACSPTRRRYFCGGEHEPTRPASSANLGAARPAHGAIFGGIFFAVLFRLFMLQRLSFGEEGGRGEREKILEGGVLMSFVLVIWGQVKGFGS